MVLNVAIIKNWLGTESEDLRTLKKHKKECERKGQKDKATSYDLLMAEQEGVVKALKAVLIEAKKNKGIELDEEDKDASVVLLAGATREIGGEEVQSIGEGKI